MSTVATEIEATEAAELAELAEHAYLELVRRSPLGPREHLDAMLGALISAHPEASVSEMASWLTWPLSGPVVSGHATRAGRDR